MQSIMAIWAGYALGGTSVAEAGLGPYIEEARAQVGRTNDGHSLELTNTSERSNLSLEARTLREVCPFG